MINLGAMSNSVFLEKLFEPHGVKTTHKVLMLATTYTNEQRHSICTVLKGIQENPHNTDLIRSVYENTRELGQLLTESTCGMKLWELQTMDKEYPTIGQNCLSGLLKAVIFIFSNFDLVYKTMEEHEKTKVLAIKAYLKTDK